LVQSNQTFVGGDLLRREDRHTCRNPARMCRPAIFPAAGTSLATTIRRDCCPPRESTAGPVIIGVTLRVRQTICPPDSCADLSVRCSTPGHYPRPEKLIIHCTPNLSTSDPK
jgi:hypothetical protein